MGAANKPVTSIATLDLKELGDWSVGEAMVSGCDFILRQLSGSDLANIGKIGVIGYGKVGQSVAHHLKSYGGGKLRDVFIADTEPQRLAACCYARLQANIFK